MEFLVGAAAEGGAGPAVAALLPAAMREEAGEESKEKKKKIRHRWQLPLAVATSMTPTCTHTRTTAPTMARAMLKRGRAPLSSLMMTVKKVGIAHYSVGVKKKEPFLAKVKRGTMLTMVKKKKRRTRKPFCSPFPSTPAASPTPLPASAAAAPPS